MTHFNLLGSENKGPKEGQKGIIIQPSIIMDKADITNCRISAAPSRVRSEVVEGTTQGVSGNEPRITAEHLSTREAQPHFSFYPKPIYNLIPSKAVTLADVYEYVVSDTAKAATETLRTITTKDKATQFKANNFDYITPSGIFTKREKHGLQSTSGILVIDIDDIPSAEEVDDIFFLLLGLPRLETLLLFHSPSGNGLKWFVPILNNEGHSHEYYFSAVSNYLLSYGIEADQSGKDIGRPCYLPYDPDAYINPKCLGL